MTEGTTVNSIDNLREYVLTAPSVCSTTRAILVGYIDEIEREVKELRDRDYRNGVEDGEMAAERDGWVRLPVDADGVPIHVGDVMEWVDEPGITRTVTSIQLVTDGWWVYINGTGRRPDKYLHHHAPTVEDVLAEFGIDWEHESDCEDRAALLKEYAARLALRGDE